MDENSDLRSSLIQKALNLCVSSDYSYNLTISPKLTIDDVESYALTEFLEGPLRIGLKPTKGDMKKGFDLQWCFRGCYEKFPNTPTRCHVHGQLYIKIETTPSANGIPLDDLKKRNLLHKYITKVHTLIGKSVGNTKMSKNLSHKEMSTHRRSLGLPESNPEYPEYAHYMYKQVRHTRDTFEISS